MLYRLIFLAPKFNRFGCDLINYINSFEKSSKFVIVYTGGANVLQKINENIDKKIIEKLIDLEKEEIRWINNKIKFDYLKSYESKFGNDYLGKLIVSDRRIGNGYVVGGHSRPSNISKLVKENPIIFPLQYIQGLLYLIDNIFRELEIKSVFIYATAAAPALSLFYFSKLYNIEYKNLHHTRILNYFAVDNNPYGTFEEILNRVNDKIDPPKNQQIKAIDFLKRFREKPFVPEYSIFNQNQNQNQKSIKHIVIYIIYFFSFYLKFLFPKKISETISAEKLRHKKFYLKREIQRLIEKNVFSELFPNEKFIYFPLHVDPESSTMVLSPYQTNQLSIIENLSKSLPSDMILVVKEHIPMLGFRPNNFYKKISTMPRVKLLSPYFDQFSLIKKSEFIVTITGTVGYEALFLSKKVLTLSDKTPYSRFKKGVIVETDLTKLSSAIKRLDKIDPLDDEYLIKFLSTLFSISFEMETSLLWGKYEEHNYNYRKDIIKTLAKKII